MIKDKIKSEEVLEKNKIDQLNRTAKIRIDYLINVNEIVMMMNKLNEDPNMSLFRLDKINALLDISLDYAWKLCHVKKRKELKIINDEDKDTYLDRYTTTVNDKLDLVNQIGELIDSYVSDACNIVDGINKCHNNSYLYYILEEDLKKCKDNGSNVYDEPDTKKKDSEPDTKKKDTQKKDTKVKDKPDTKKKDAKKKDSKPNIKVKNKPGNKVKDKSDTKVKDKQNTKVKDKPDAKESSGSKNEPQKTLSNGELAKTLDHIKKIFECFVCKKFINNTFRLRGQDKDGIALCTISKPDKHSKITHEIAICRDAISLNTEKKQRV